MLMIFLSCFLLGCVTGLRSLTAPAAVCWGAYLGWLHFAGTKLAFVGHSAILIIFTLLALLELIIDKLPRTPARTAGPGLSARVLMGAFCGSALAVSAGGSLIVAAVSGMAGALAGTFGGYNVRQVLVTKKHLPDFALALLEDMIAIAGSFLIVYHLRTTVL